MALWHAAPSAAQVAYSDMLLAFMLQLVSSSQLPAALQEASEAYIPSGH